MAEKDPFPVLLAEDNHDDIVAIRRAWKQAKIANPLFVVRNGEECLDFLYQRGAYSEPDTAPWPGLLLLDIRMPRLDGLQVLKRIRAEKGLRRLPVVILTTSKDEEDRLTSYDLGVNAYITKPVGFDNLTKAIEAINVFWQLVELPD
jgi:two-component system, response regulator